MSAATDAGIEPQWAADATATGPAVGLPPRGTHLWLGVLLVAGSALVSIRCLCWLAGQVVRLLG